MYTVVIEERFRGPAVSGNGGYTSGLLAEALGGGRDGAVEVTLRRPPPLDHKLRIEKERNQAHMFDGAHLVAEAIEAESFTVNLPDVGVDAAVEASKGYPGFLVHPFPGCFVCGTDRETGDGLRIFPGRVDDTPYFAAPWYVGGDAEVEGPVIWASLDCPSGWSADLEGRPAVLGRMTAQVLRAPRPGSTAVVMGTTFEVEGRKSFTASALFEGGEMIAWARHTWIEIDPADFNG